MTQPPTTPAQVLAIYLSPPAELKEGQQLGFTARSLQVSNPTSAWYFLPDQQVTIPPGIIGMIVPLGGTERARVLFQAPPSVTNPTTSFVGQIVLTYSEDAFPPNPGLAAYGLTPPGANSDYITLPATGAAITYALKGPSNRPILALFVTSQGKGELNISVAVSIGGGAVVTFDNIKNYLDFTADLTDNIYFLIVPYSLPARATLAISQTTGVILQGVILY